MPRTDPQPPPSPLPFAEHYRRSLDELRGALTELYLALGADPERPQEVARRHGIHRNLAWKLTRVMRPAEPDGVLPYLPGEQGLERALDAFRASDAPEERIASVRRAWDGFQGMVARHAGDRPTLELMLDSAGLDGAADPLEVSRRLALRGNSGVLGLQARGRVRTDVIAPHRERSDLLDLAQVSALVDLRRFRPDAACPLIQRAHYNDDGTRRESRVEPVDEGLGELRDTLLWREYCSDPLPEIRVVPTRLGSRYEIVAGAVGNQGRTTVVQAGVTERFASRYRDARNAHGELTADVTVPTEHLLFDVLVHRDLEDEMALDSQLLLVDDPDQHGGPAPRLPVAERLHRLGSVPPRVGTPLWPSYGDLVLALLDRRGWRIEDFRALRFEMECPPLRSRVRLSYALPERP